nr:glutathione S-transferase [Oscarella lobularis]
MRVLKEGKKAGLWTPFLIRLVRSSLLKFRSCLACLFPTCKMGNSGSMKTPTSQQENRSSSRKKSRFGSLRRKKSKQQQQQTKKDPVKLYVNKPNASCRMVWLYCAENDVPFDLQFVDEHRGETATAEFHEMNPHESVPILKDGDVVVFESIAILYYLANSHTSFAGFGKTLKAQSTAGSLCCWACKTLTKAIAYHFVFPQFVDAYKLESFEANAALIEQGRKEVSACLDTIQNEYLTRAGHDYLLGDDYTVADMCVATVLTLLESVPDFDWDPWPKVSAWMEKIKARPKWEEVNENHAEYVEKLVMRQKEGSRRRIQQVASVLCPLDDDKDDEEKERKVTTTTLTVTAAVAAASASPANDGGGEGGGGGEGDFLEGGSSVFSDVTSTDDVTSPFFSFDSFDVVTLNVFVATVSVS